MAPDWGISRIHVETDDQQLVHALANHNQDLSRNGMVFKEIRSLALLNFNTSNNKKKNFVTSIILYCPRMCDRIADALAAFGTKMVHEPKRLCW